MGKIADIIKYEGDNSTFIWKHECEDFNSMTQLIVHESQEAIFFMNGQALDLFGPGRHTLETQNIPLLGRLLNRSTGGETPFHCEVYFINKTVQMAIKWGTPDKVRIMEPNYSIPIEIGASGEMNLTVSDSRKLLLKLVGTMNGISWDERGMGFTKSLQNCFRPLITTAVKSNLSAAIKEKNIDILEIDEQLEVLSEGLRKKISAGFEEYGLTIPQFYISHVVLPENDPNFKKIRDLHSINLQTKLANAEAIVKTAQIEADASVKLAQASADTAVTSARRQVTLEQQITETEVAKAQAERDLIKAQAAATAKKLDGFAEAEIMSAQGYNMKDVFAADVQKAYAEGLGNMGGNAGGGIVGDMVGLGVGMAAAGSFGAQMQNMFGAFNPQANAAAPAAAPAPKAEAIKCPSCGSDVPGNAKFCLECGTKIEKLQENEMICPHCGQKTAKGKFCGECGGKLVQKCSGCGADIQPGAKFCLECGTKL